MLPILQPEDFNRNEGKKPLGVGRKMNEKEIIAKEAFKNGMRQVIMCNPNLTDLQKHQMIQKIEEAAQNADFCTWVLEQFGLLRN